MFWLVGWLGGNKRVFLIYTPDYFTVFDLVHHASDDVLRIPHFLFVPRTKPPGCDGMFSL